MKNTTLLPLLFLAFSFHAIAQSDSVSFSLYPNPNNGVFNVSLQSQTEQKVLLSIAKNSGLIIKADSQQVHKGNNIFRYDISNQPEGKYFVILNGSNGTISKLLVLTKPIPTRYDSIDILHYDLSLTIRNISSKTIGGTAKLKLKSKINGLSQFTLDLLTLNVSAIRMNGITQNFSQTDSTLFVQLGSPQQQNDTFEISIDYNGSPVTDATWGGFYFSGNYAYNMGVGFTSNPHNFGRCWFPCIDNFTDRATYSFHITTDAGFKAVCNGLMSPETPNQDGSTTWNWQINQPIPTYLASVAVGQYEFIKYEFAGKSRTYPVWIAAIAADTAKARFALAKLNQALTVFEEKFGSYPFDRVGYVIVPFSAGAMEHAANIAFPNYAINDPANNETLFAHELSHMWWGNLATCRTAEDMWLNEGWASYNEALFLEYVYGKQAYFNFIRDKSIDVLHNAPKDDGAWLPVSGVPHHATYGTHEYKKGLLMAHTLRSLMGDSAFFAATLNYMQNHQFTDVTTEDLQISFQAYTQQDLTSFFQKWIYSPGHSDIVLSGYSQINNTYHFDFTELNRINSLTSASLPFTFKMYLSNGTQLNRLLNLNNGSASFDTTLTQGISYYDYGINEDYTVQLAHTAQKQPISATGAVSFANALASINIQTPGSAGDSLTITHHWVGPIDGNLKAQGIRISSERYWTVQGKLSESLVAWGFLNYDGISNHFLDADLITQTEDSLVLLYRQNPNIDWSIVTDLTFQPGPSKTDKTGRFWVNNLKRGEYAFGMIDASVVGIKEVSAQTAHTFRIVPNPTDSESHITLLFAQPSFIKQVTIVNVKGQNIKSVVVGKQMDQLLLDISELPQGTYFVCAQLNGMVISQQLIKGK
jgi:hypothetical protein